MNGYLDFATDPAAASATLDAQSGNVLFFAGLDRPEAQAVMSIYAANSSRGGSLDTETGTRYTAPGLVVQGAWETYLTVTQAHVWTTAWKAWFLEESLSPSKMLYECMDAVIRYYETA